MSIYMLIRLPLCCFLIVTYCFWYYRTKKRLRTRMTRNFEMMSVAGIVHLLAATVTEYTVNNRDKVPEYYNLIWHIIFLVSLTVVIFFLQYYLILYVERGTGRSRKKEKVALIAVCAVGILAQAVLPIEYIDTPSGSYSLGPKAYALYVVIVYVIVTMVVDLIRFWTLIGREKSNVLLACIAVFLIIFAVQYLFPACLLTSLGVALIVLGIMLNTEDVHLYVSYKTDLYNELGCREIILEDLLTGQDFQVGVYVFLGDDDLIRETMISLEHRLRHEKSRIICGTMADNVLVLMPSFGWKGVDKLPETLPESGADGISVRYMCKALDIKAGSTYAQVEEAVRECKTRYEEETFQKDGLTGLLRREAYIRQVENLISLGTSFSFLMVDVDDFRSINNTFGHSVGDDALKFVADTLSTTLRSSDIIGRLGGDEFSVVLYGVTDRELITEICHRILENLKREQILPDPNRRLTISIGVKQQDSESERMSFQELYIAADKALYKTKDSGKGSVCFID